MASNPLASKLPVPPSEGGLAFMFVVLKLPTMIQNCLKIVENSSNTSIISFISSSREKTVKNKLAGGLTTHLKNIEKYICSF